MDHRRAVEIRVEGYAFLEALAGEYENGQLIITFHQGRIAKIQTPNETRTTSASDYDAAFGFKPKR